MGKVLLGTLQAEQVFKYRWCEYRVFLPPLDMKYQPNNGTVLCLNLNTNLMEWLQRKTKVGAVSRETFFLKVLKIQ